MQWKEHVFRGQEDQRGSIAYYLCELDKLLRLSMLQFPHLTNENNDHNTCHHLIGFL